MIARKTKKTSSHPMKIVPVLLKSALVSLALLVTIVAFARSEFASFEPLELSHGDLKEVDQYIQDYLINSKSTEKLLERSFIYFPAIEKELGLQGLPQALKILPLIESRCDPLARSRVGAEGLWQFMIPTARQLGLRITTELDERRDPTKATRAALSYLQYLYSKYEDWTLALAAYNAGPGRVNRAIRMAGGKKSFESIKAYLPKETRQYIPKYTALQYVVRHHEAHGISPQLPELDRQWVGNVHLKNKMSLEEIAEITEVAEETLAFLNPALKRKYVPTLAQGYDLILPRRVMAIFEYYLATQERMPNPLAYRTLEMTVESKQSIHRLAANLNLDPYLLKWWNGLRDEFVVPGQVIVIHDLVNPNQIVRELAEPDAFKKVEDIQPLPDRFDLIKTFEQVYLKMLLDREESQNWDLHQIMTI